MALHRPSTLAPALASSERNSMLLTAFPPAEGISSVRVFDPWIQYCVQHVHGKIDEDDDDGDVHHQVLHDRIVAPADSLDEEPRYSGNVEDSLGDDQAAHQEGGLDADHGDDRQDRVLERVMVVDDILGCAFGA